MTDDRTRLLLGHDALPFEAATYWAVLRALFELPVPPAAIRHPNHVSFALQGWQSLQSILNPPGDRRICLRSVQDLPRDGSGWSGRAVHRIEGAFLHANLAQAWEALYARGLLPRFRFQWRWRTEWVDGPDRFRDAPDSMRDLVSIALLGAERLLAIESLMEEIYARLVDHPELQHVGTLLQAGQLHLRPMSHVHGKELVQYQEVWPEGSYRYNVIREPVLSLRALGADARITTMDRMPMLCFYPPVTYTNWAELSFP